jgi:hypothetical protein
LISFKENKMRLRKTILCAALAVSAAMASVTSQAAKEIIVQVAPPEVRVETVPTLRSGYVWQPGYWNYSNKHYVWIGGRQVRERNGYHWVPHRWEEREGHWHMHNGYWEK